MQSGDDSRVAATWEDIVGHDTVKAYLRRITDQRRVAHAYCFSGPDGVGKAMAARAWARDLLCADPEEGRACGLCRMCQQMTSGFHPDFHWVAPEDRSVRISQVRDLRDDFSLMPFEAVRKVAIIDRAETMTIEAQNALLKLLEEPPAGAVLILVCSQAGALLPTVRSRCQWVRFQVLARREVVDVLQRAGVPPDQAALLASVTEGRLQAALAAKDTDFVSLRGRIAAWIAQMSTPHAPRTIVEATVHLEQERESVEHVLNILSLWLRDLLLVREGIEQSTANRDVIDQLREQAQRLHGADVAGAVLAVERARRRLGDNTHFRLTVGAMWTQLQRSLSP